MSKIRKNKSNKNKEIQRTIVWDIGLDTIYLWESQSTY